MTDRHIERSNQVRSSNFHKFEQPDGSQVLADGTHLTPERLFAELERRYAIERIALNAIDQPSGEAFFISEGDLRITLLIEKVV